MEDDYIPDEERAHPCSAFVILGIASVLIWIGAGTLLYLNL